MPSSRHCAHLVIALQMFSGVGLRGDLSSYATPGCNVAPVPGEAPVSRSVRSSQSFRRPFRGRAPVAAVVLLITAALSVVGVVAPVQADASPFQVTMTPSTTTPASGSQLMYTINVTNTGGDITQDTVLT